MDPRDISYKITKGDEVLSLLTVIMRELDEGGRIALRNLLDERTPDPEPTEVGFYKWLTKAVGKAYLYDDSNKKDVLKMAKLLKYWYIQFGVQGSADEVSKDDLISVREEWDKILNKKQNEGE